MWRVCVFFFLFLSINAKLRVLKGIIGVFCLWSLYYVIFCSVAVGVAVKGGKELGM